MYEGERKNVRIPTTADLGNGKLLKHHWTTYISLLKLVFWMMRIDYAVNAVLSFSNAQ